MLSRRDRLVEGEAPIARFLDRVRAAFSHDLRTPLGSIVNYAAVLESKAGAESEDVRDLGRRIRSNAQRASRMIQLLAGGMGLASRPLRAASTDVVALAQAVLTDTGVQGRARPGASSQDTLTEVDPEVLGFALRAYAALEHDARGKSPADVDLLVRKESGHVQIDVSTHGPRGAADSTTGPNFDAGELELTQFLRHNGGADRLETSLGLKLAQDLLVSLGGDLQVYGRPGLGSGMRLRIPLTG